MGHDEMLQVLKEKMRLEGQLESLSSEASQVMKQRLPHNPVVLVPSFITLIHYSYMELSKNKGAVCSELILSIVSPFDLSFKVFKHHRGRSQRLTVTQPTCSCFLRHRGNGDRFKLCWSNPLLMKSPDIYNCIFLKT